MGTKIENFSISSLSLCKVGIQLHVHLFFCFRARHGRKLMLKASDFFLCLRELSHFMMKRMLLLSLQFTVKFFEEKMQQAEWTDTSTVFVFLRGRLQDCVTFFFMLRVIIKLGWTNLLWRLYIHKTFWWRWILWWTKKKIRIWRVFLESISFYLWRCFTWLQKFATFSTTWKMNINSIRRCFV